jgi:hypothetical protein
MPKLNFDSKLNSDSGLIVGHGLSHSRDLGGISSRMALAFVLVMCVEWTFLIYMRS